MFKKAHLTILISLLLHVVVILLLNNSQTMVIPNLNNTPKTIKSYFYHRPKVEIKKEVPQLKQEKSQKKQSRSEIKKIEAVKPLSDKQLTKQAKFPPQKPIETNSIEPLKTLIPPPLNTPSIKTINPKAKIAHQHSFSMRNLRQLREKIQQQTNKEFQRGLGQPNTGSIMHGTPTLVPHSTVTQSNDEKKKQATLSMSADKSIIKGDDGNCSLVEDLSVVGMEGVTAVSGFSCGETKFDKSFREHMNKVRTKLGKK